MSNIIIIGLGAVGMLLSFKLGELHQLNKFEEMLEDDIINEEVDKMVRGTD